MNFFLSTLMIWGSWGNLPSHLVHNFIDRYYFGRSYPKLHKELDRPVIIYGKRHRILFHDLSWAIFIARKLYPGDINAEKSACLHLEIDESCSKDKEFRKFLEKWARRTARQDKQNRKLMKKIQERNKSSKRRPKKQKDYNYWFKFFQKVAS